jgi:hypothetical protein
MMLDDLSGIPAIPAECHELLFGDTGAVVHEVGHVAGAALNGGTPTDYVIFDWSEDALRHATYTDVRYREPMPATWRCRSRPWRQGLWRRG